jgi:hydrogenase maturation protease
MHVMHESAVEPAVKDRALVVCIGNDLVGDDGAGCAVYHALRKENLPDDVGLLQLGVGGISILEHLDKLYETLIVVDAVRYGSVPGTIHRDALESLPQTHQGAVSAHGLGMREIIDAGRFLYPEQIPGSILCIGIEGENFNECGAPLSQSVQNAIGKAVELIRETLSV